MARGSGGRKKGTNVAGRIASSKKLGKSASKSARSASSGLRQAASQIRRAQKSE